MSGHVTLYASTYMYAGSINGIMCAFPTQQYAKLMFSVSVSTDSDNYEEHCVDSTLVATMHAVNLLLLYRVSRSHIPVL